MLCLRDGGEVGVMKGEAVFCGVFLQSALRWL